MTVTARVTGDFPGSPVDLRYRFTLEGATIARLEITAASFDLGLSGRRAIVTAGTNCHSPRRAEEKVPS